MYAVLAVFLSFSTLFLPLHDLGRARLEARLISHTVKVMAFGGYTPDGETFYNLCTGFVVAPGYVLTALHCEGAFLRVDGELATIEAQDPDFDLLLVKANTRRKPPVTISTELPGGEIIGVGWGEGKLQVVPALVVALHVPMHKSLGIIGHPGWIHGMSGGPIYNGRGEVVGMAVSVCCQGAYGYGPEAGALVAFLEAAGVTLPR